MRACARLSVERDPAGGPHRIVEMESAAPVSWRPTPGAMYMVGAAASPVADDDVRVEIDVGPGACLAVRSAAATVAWRGRGTLQRVHARVEAGGGLDWAPEPVIATAGCRHAQHATVTVAAGGWLVWEEQLVLGRHNESPGVLHASLSVEVAGRALLRHGLRVGDPGTGWDSEAVLGAAGAGGLLVVAGRAPVPDAQGPGWSVMTLDGPGSMGLAVAPDAITLARAMGEMRAALGVGRERPWTT